MQARVWVACRQVELSSPAAVRGRDWVVPYATFLLRVRKTETDAGGSGNSSFTWSRGTPGACPAGLSLARAWVFTIGAVADKLTVELEYWRMLCA